MTIRNYHLLALLLLLLGSCSQRNAIRSNIKITDERKEPQVFVVHDYRGQIVYEQNNDTGLCLYYINQESSVPAIPLKDINLVNASKTHSILNLCADEDCGKSRNEYNIIITTVILFDKYLRIKDVRFLNLREQEKRNATMFTNAVWRTSGMWFLNSPDEKKDHEDTSFFIHVLKIRFI